MPPARTFLRASTSELPEFDRQQNSLKGSSSYRRSSYLTPEVKNKNKKGKSNIENDFMNLDEFFTKTLPQDDDSSSKFEEENDYPKPNVDLLASLVTLGKMIKDQKELIQRQQEQQSNDILNNTTPPGQNCLEDSDSFAVIVKKNESQMTDSRDESVVNVNEDCSPYELKEQEKIQPNSNKITPPNASHNEIGNRLLESPVTSKRSLIPEEIKDLDYWDRRKRNNMAAKKSREERRRRELEILEAAKNLEKENAQLATMLKRLTARNELLEARLQTIRRKHLNSSDDNFDTNSTENSL